LTTRLPSISTRAPMFMPWACWAPSQMCRNSSSRWCG
jgi:hypothetical protein